MNLRVKAIKTESDYDEALCQIEKLMGAKLDTKAYDGIDLLITRAEAYEKEHHTIDLSDPLEAIKFRIDQMR